MTTTVCLDDVELTVELEGSGCPLLLVHGFPLSRRMWDAQIEAFAATHRVIAPDLRGFGESGVTDGTVTMERLADDLVGVLTALGITERVVLCGLSMGGYIALAFWHKYADRLAGLVLADTRAAGDTEQVARERMALADRVLREGPTPVVDGMMGKLFAARTHSMNPDLVEQVRGMMSATSPAGVVAALRGMAVRQDWTAELSRIDVPSLVIVGAADVISPPADMRALADALPHGEFVEIPGAGHMTPMEDPKAFNRAMCVFLDRLG